MEIILKISAQPATFGISRQMTVIGMDFQNAPIAEARDAKLPAQIHFKKGDYFPWGDYLQKLAVAWQLSRNDVIPKEFRLKKALPHEVVDLIPQIPAASALNLLKQLGASGYISAFSKL